MTKEQIVNTQQGQMVYRTDICAVYAVTDGYYNGEGSDINLMLVGGANSSPKTMRLNIDTCHLLNHLDMSLENIDPHLYAKMFLIEKQVREIKKKFNF